MELSREKTLSCVGYMPKLFTQSKTAQRTMIKTYTLKLYPNKNKAKKLNSLISFWRDQINHKIKVFWEFTDVKGARPNSEYRLGGRLISDASVKAWQIVNGANATEQKHRPTFDGCEIDLNSASAYIIEEFKTPEFDIWFNVISLEKGHRLKLPAKKTQIFNDAVKEGVLRKSFKLIKKNDEYYMQCFVEFPEPDQNNVNVVGVDVGLNHAAVTSNGRFYDSGVKDLQKRTKHRAYNKGISATKQALNRVAKEIVEDHPDCDFAVEELLFKGKKGRSRSFRRKHGRWAYNYLSKKLTEIGITEGFGVKSVDPRYTSQRCPMCGCIDKRNRVNESFKCIECGHAGHADHVASINISERVLKDFPYLKPLIRNDLL